MIGARQPRPEDTVPDRAELEAAVAGALERRFDQLEQALRALAAGLRDELLASRVREIAARKPTKPEDILAAWGEILFVLELEERG